MQVYLGLGTNTGNKEQNLCDVVARIEIGIGKVLSLSRFYVTAPWGFASENDFLNAACCVETLLSPMELLEKTQSIERDMGRTEKSQHGLYHDRLIDIDLLLCDNLIINTELLTIPHPFMALRRFVMEPLSEIAPEVIHPVTGQTMREILLVLTTTSD